MIAGNPIITHKSHIWNAHLEYLRPEFSFIAEQHDVQKYKEHMESIIQAKSNGKILQMRETSEMTGKKLFIINNSIAKIETMIDCAVKI